VDVLDVKGFDRTLMTACLAGLSSIGATACGGPVRLVRPRVCPTQGLASEWLPATLALPRREESFIPPMPVSTSVRGSHAVIRVVIDTFGHVMADSVTVCGIADPMYAQRMAEEVSRLRFRPGLMNAKHVIAPTFIPFAF
jgi:hypothetical protein